MCGAILKARESKNKYYFAENACSTYTYNIRDVGGVDKKKKKKMEQGLGQGVEPRRAWTNNVDYYQNVYFLVSFSTFFLRNKIFFFSFCTCNPGVPMSLGKIEGNIFRDSFITCSEAITKWMVNNKNILSSINNAAIV